MAVLDHNDREHRRIAKRLQEERIIWLTTVRENGQPQSVPVWFLWDGESFRMFSQPGKPKLDNIRKNRRVGLHLQATESGSDVVVFEGEAEILDGPTATEIPEYIEKYSAQIEEYGWTPQSFSEDYSEPLRIRPERVRAW